MPIENERKYVLKLKSCEHTFRKAALYIREMEQFYLISGKNQSLRCRKTTTAKKVEHTLTFKQEVKGKVVEIETVINERDYSMLKTKSKSELKKIRYHIAEKGGEEWEVDFFKSKSKNYFVQAEVEMPEEQKEPKSIPKLIQDNLIYVVASGDKRFTSRRLCDSKHARKLLKLIKENT